MSQDPSFYSASIPGIVIAATQSDSVDETVAGVVYVQTGGNIKFTTVSGNDVTFTVSDETWIPVKIKRVWSTGTTATGIYICY